ncbi:conserved hypothetical protein (plasmid) [Rhodococcus jostii RHA1]|uniref:Uncharacterized protein n=1 Tax=Rhodococcus jostii (strain RHA1) TaxID=101510 RepID=Q0RYA5_RHOJR|nr:conserved hypothetical protein [Rhodococcus jostii RHA1]
MARPAGNPVLAPIRRWVLYSRTNLMISMAAILAVLFVAGTVFGESPPTSHTPSTAAVTGAPTTTPAQGNEVTYDLIEVTESAIAGLTTAAAGKSAPATAMAYAHSYVDITQSNTEWRTKLGRYTIDTPGDTIVVARPQVPVAITGPTTSETVTGAGGARRAEVTIPTQAGDLRVSVQVAESPSGAKWQVQNPFPTLDRDEVSKLGAAPTLVSVPSTSSHSTTPQTATQPITSQPKPSTTTSAPESVTAPPAMSEPEPTPVPVPVPEPGPIPIPELDTPIPGAL